MRKNPANAMNRRSFLQTVPAGMAAAALLQSHAGYAQAGAKATAQSAAQPAAAITPRTVFVASDAAPVAPETLLATLEAALARHPGKEDNYLKAARLRSWSRPLPPCWARKTAACCPRARWRTTLPCAFCAAATST